MLTINVYVPRESSLCQKSHIVYVTDVHGLLRIISKHSYRSCNFDLKNGSRKKEWQLKHRYIGNRNETLMMLLNALSESSRRSLRYHKRLREKLIRNDESIVLLKKALDSLCEGIIDNNLTYKSALNIEEKLECLVRKNKMKIDTIYEMERSLNRLKKDLDEKSKQLAMKDTVILEQKKIIRNLQGLNQRYTRTMKENVTRDGPENIRKLAQCQTGDTNTQTNFAKESENDLSKFTDGDGNNVSHQGDECDETSHSSCDVTSQHIHSEITGPIVSITNDDLSSPSVRERNSVTSEMMANCRKLSDIQRQQKAESNISLCPSSSAISDNTSVESPGLISISANQRVMHIKPCDITVRDDVKCTGNCRFVKQQKRILCNMLNA